MILYLDTSALVKLYVREPGSVRTRNLLTRAQAASTSIVAYAETRAAFGRLMRSEMTTSARHRQRVARFNQDWDAYVRVALSSFVARAAGDLAETHGLRGFDAIHLASALALKDRAPQEVWFCCFDQRLCAAALAVGLPVAPGNPRASP